jgi:hypothetical protein
VVKLKRAEALLVAAVLTLATFVFDGPDLTVMKKR